MTISPYKGVDVNNWANVTNNLIKDHPLKEDFLIKTILDSWASILNTTIDIYTIGKDIFPSPQTMSFFLHELIPLKIQQRYPDEWRTEITSADKDIVCIKDPKYSIEIKASSSKRNIYGNRSYSQKTDVSKKSKSGYYLAINFEKYDDKSTNSPKITMIRFGWIDHGDWQGQKTSSGQQARLSPDVELRKLKIIYINNN